MDLCNTCQKQNTRWLLLSLALFALDQISKHLALNYLTLSQSIKVTSFFNVTLLFNRGAAFSFLNEAGGWQHWLFGGIALLVCCGILFLISYLKPTARLYLLSLSMILGGAIGNLWDRLQYGFVVDFLHFHFQDWHFAIFNVADSAITVGTILLLSMQFVELKKQNRATSNQ